jgi:pimeloyl-ACP methyl ester carboxylesterase
MAAVERHFVGVPAGVVHYAVCGTGDPVLLLHQTPRSWDEYRDVLPLLGRTRRAIAMDTIGFGDSSRLPRGEDSIERWAEVAISLLDALDIGRTALVGHHTGGYIAIEIAATRPERVSALVLSGVALHRVDRRLEHARTAQVDDARPELDGSHLLSLWQQRAGFYPEDVDLLERFMIDCLRAGELAAEGHRIVGRYAVEQRLPLVSCPALLIAPTADPYAFPAVPGLDAALPHASVTPIEGGMVPLPDQLPGPYADAVETFLDGLDHAAGLLDRGT